jgi:hypothetical protein
MGSASPGDFSPYIKVWYEYYSVSLIPLALLYVSMDMTDNDAPSCPNCGSDETYYGEYGIGCNNNGFGAFDDGCPIVFFHEQ